MNQLDTHNGIPIFKILDFLIGNNLILKSENENRILKKSVNLWNGFEGYVQDELANDLEITGERVRQIRTQISRDFDSLFSLLLEFDSSQIREYISDFNGISPKLNPYVVDNINSSESTHFNSDFICFILSIIQGNHIELIGSVSSVFFNSDKDYMWKSLYLLKSNEFNKDSLSELLLEINRAMEMRIDDDIE
jgi:hypothetical protein